MKNCAYCGRDNADEAVACRECGTTEFRTPLPPEPPVKFNAKDDLPVYDPVPDESPSGEHALCTSCLFPNSPDTPFCKRCAAPLGFISTLGPMEHLYAEGTAYRKAVEGRPKFVVFLGVWLIFFPGLLGCLFVMLAIFSGLIGGAAGLISFWVSCALGTICAVMLYRVTKNYVSLPKQDKNGNEA